MQWLFLSVAVVAEVIATSTLKVSDGFSRFVPSLVVIIGYGVSFYFLSLTLRTMPVGVAYAVGSGVGIALISLIVGYSWASHWTHLRSLVSR
jgi:small multidrug resistance pump